ncbi:hypothetical protein [Geodermatophilus sp. SYSU D01176]
MTTPDRDEQLRALHRAFNARDVDSVLSAMTADVDWPNGWQGGRVVGHGAVLAVGDVCHVYASTGDLVRRMDVEQH